MGDRIRLVCFAGQRFGKSRVLDPEVRKISSDGKQRRYVLLRCGECQVTEYLAPISHLYQGRYKTCANCSKPGVPRKTPGGRVYRNRGGYIVTVHVGWYKSKAEAQEVAARARVVFIPAPKDLPRAL